jgi:hypothetical protein
MKRAKPKQHIRRLKSGKRVVVNKGVKRRRFKDYEYAVATKRIQQNRTVNNNLKRTYDRLGEEIEDKNSTSYKRPLEIQREHIKRMIRDNQANVDFLNKKYFPENPR